MTQRNIAVDQIDSKYLHGKYILDVHVAQLDRKSNLWGAEVISDGSHVVNPKYVSRRNSMWLLSYEFQKPVQYMIFYSVERQPAYGKNYYGSYLAKDVIKEGCLRFRKVGSILDSYFMESCNHNNESGDGFMMMSSFRDFSIGKNEK